MSSEPIGLLIMAYGTPRSMDEVEAYYTHIRHGRPPSPEELEDLKARYRAIGGVSPLNEITRRQVDGIARRVAQRVQYPVRAYMGMKHAPPFIADAVADLVRDGIRRGVSLVLTPQYSAMSVGAYQRAVREALAKAEADVHVLHVDHWHLHPGFVNAVARRLKEAHDRLPPAARARPITVFTAHSLPARLVETGDPYDAHLRETAAAVAAAAGLERWEVAYQSAGRTDVPWLGPDICEVIPELARRGHSAIVVCPVGFVADHLEILYDIDIEARQVAQEAGIHLARSESLNDAADFLDALADVILSRLEHVTVS